MGFSYQHMLVALCCLSLLACVLQHSALSKFSAQQSQKQPPAATWKGPSLWRASTRPCDLPHGTNQSDHTAERFLVYAPPLGLSGQLIVLRSAVAWAVSLNRTLVLPHLLPEAVPPPHGLAFDDVFEVRRASLHPLRVIGMDAFLRLRRSPSVIVDLQKASGPHESSRSYLASLSVGWHRLPPVRVAMGHFTPSTIQERFGECDGHAVLAFFSLVDSFDLAPLGGSAVGATAGLALGSRSGIRTRADPNEGGSEQGQFGDLTGLRQGS